VGDPFAAFRILRIVRRADVALGMVLDAPLRDGQNKEQI